MRPVLILAHSWPPDSNVGAVRPVYLCKQLASLGWRPIVVTVKERYYDHTNPAGIAGTDSALVVRTHSIRNPRDAYLWLKKVIGRLSIGRRRETREASRSSIRHQEIASTSTVSRFKQTLLSLLHTPDEFFGWFPFALVTSLRLILKHRPACIISTAPPFTSHLIALVLNAVTRTPWVADFRDPWSWREGLPAEISSSLSCRINRFLEKVVVRRADRVVCVTPATTEKYRQMYPESPKDKWVTVTNGFDLDEFAGLGPVEEPDKFTICYVGGFDFSRTPRLLLRAVEGLISDGLMDNDKIAVRFVGPCEIADGIPVSHMIEECGLREIAVVVGFVPRPDALKEMLRSSLLLLLGGSQRLSVAAKLYEYLAVARPIMAITHEGATAEIIRSTRVGDIVAPDDLCAAKRVIAMRYQEYMTAQSNGKNAGVAVISTASEYNWKSLGSRYAAILESCSSQAQ